jgi:hypothetical protein
MAVLLGTRLLMVLTDAGAPADTISAFPQGGGVAHTLTIPQPVASLTVESGGGPVQILSEKVAQVQITERVFSGNPGSTASAVAHTASGARYTLTDPSCGNSGCSIAYTILTPPDVSVTVSSGGGTIEISGVRTADANSGGGSVHAQQIGGPLTVTSNGGPVTANGITGPVSISSGGGTVTASGLTSARADVTSNGGPAVLGFTTEPDSVSVSTGGGTARVDVPGGSYAVTANSGGGPETVKVAISPAASQAINVNSGGGPLFITTAAGTAGTGTAVSIGGAGGAPPAPSAPTPPAVP